MFTCTYCFVLYTYSLFVQLKQRQLRKHDQAELNLNQKSTVLKELKSVAGGGVSYSSVMSTNRKVTAFKRLMYAGFTISPSYLYNYLFSGEAEAI